MSGASAGGEYSDPAAARVATATPAGGLVVFDFDHTLYRGDSGSNLFAWLIKRNPLRLLAALLIAPLFGPMIAFLPTRRRGISAFVWVATVGLHRRCELDTLIDRYVAGNVEVLKARLLPQALAVFRAHREAGDTVVVATGAPPELARAILAFAEHEQVPVIGSLVGAHFGAVTARRHCHAEGKMAMLREAGFSAPIMRAYTDSTADMPLLRAARQPVVVNPKRHRIATFRRVLGAGVPVLDWDGR